MGLMVSEIKQFIFPCTNGQFFRGLMTAQALDQFLYVEIFPYTYLNKMSSCVTQNVNLFLSENSPHIIKDDLICFCSD
jgi:hypothetical protein